MKAIRNSRVYHMVACEMWRLVVMILLWCDPYLGIDSVIIELIIYFKWVLVEKFFHLKDPSLVSKIKLALILF